MEPVTVKVEIVIDYTNDEGEPAHDERVIVVKGETSTEDFDAD